jgi:hypothetical protein
VLAKNSEEEQQCLNRARDLIAKGELDLAESELEKVEQDRLKQKFILWNNIAQIRERQKIDAEIIS